MKRSKNLSEERDERNLILSRKEKEAVIIDGRAEIEIVKVSGSRVKIKIKSPKTTTVLRKELL